ncbi:prophage endopeptidase tail family protein [Bacillus siamensis]|uniref:prophage endopeptidase tail family protein n=1 Tax=Bacillus amyloliquefaciens group TaxID=1938374 RepID=UPI002E242E63|nr:prophage endopeptidase tail family protein [Bacillus siamensis]MED0836433.1 prophage endopeptidase tail family protein [Bacillus siamensis]
MKILIVKNPEYEEIVIDFTDFERSIESNLTNWQISFNITQTNANTFVFNLLQSDQASLLFEGQEYVIQQINPVLSGNTQTISVTATHIYYDVQKKIRLEDTIDSDYEDDSRPKHTLEEYLSYLFKGNTYGYSYEIKGAFTARKLITEFGKSDAVSLINTLIDTFQCYVMADNKKVIFMDEAHFKTVTEEQFRWLYNTDDINLSLDKTNLRTKCWVYPYKDAHDNYFFEPYVYTSVNAARFGDSFAEPLDLTGDTDATTKKYTDAEAVKHLQDVPEATFTLNYYGSRLPTIGEVWMAIIEPMGLDVDVSIVGVKDYPFDDTKAAELTFSNARKDMLSIQQQISKKATTAYNKSHIATELISSVQNVAVNAWDARLVIEKVGEVDD